MLKRSCLRRSAIGFIGLGQMGGRMAPNLFKNAHNTEVHIFDTNAASVDEVAQACGDKKVVKCKTPAEVAKNCHRIITMLPNGKISRAVFEEIFTTIQKGTFLIDSSTVDPQTPRDLRDISAKLGCTFVDAPVSGGVTAAAAGSLTFMIGAADEATFNKAKGILEGTVAKAVVHCGDVGAGTVVKLCNNLILAQHMVAVSEAMVMGTKLGVDPKLLAGVISQSTGRCWSMDLYNPYPGLIPGIPSANNYQGGFGAALMLKDVGLAIEAAKTQGVETRGAANAMTMYTEMCNAGDGNLDFSGIIKHIDKK